MPSPNNKRPWTVAEVRTLRRYHDRQPLNLLAVRLGRSPQAIHEQAVRLGLRNRSRRHWSEGEIVALREHYPTKGGEFVAQLLNRTAKAVYAKVIKLGVTSGRN